ncbi:hypothetical protein TNCV_1734491 [Trichonephila clavipes]|nr:hypothetical protein TNCV_1734491 [Trichonephila clavipes]
MSAPGECTRSAKIYSTTVFSDERSTGDDGEESNDEEYKSKYGSSTEIDPDLEEGDAVENKCFICSDTKTFGKNVILKEATGTHLTHFQMNF